MAPRVITASEIREYVFCPRSWAYRHRGVPASLKALEQREERLEYGNRSHREHGEAVCRVSRQLGYGTGLAGLGLTIVTLGVMWLCLA